LHGGESRDFCEKISRPKIYAIQICNEKSLAKIAEIEPVVDFFLFDGRNPGSGESFDAVILENFLRKNPNFKKLFFVAGGIYEKNLTEILVRFSKFENFLGVDLASGAECDGNLCEKKIAEIARKF